MDKDITGDLGITIGMDVSDRFKETFAIDERGEWIESWRAVCAPPADRAFELRPGAPVRGGAILLRS